MKSDASSKNDAKNNYNIYNSKTTCKCFPYGLKLQFSLYKYLGTYLIDLSAFELKQIKFFWQPVKINNDLTQILKLNP